MLKFSFVLLAALISVNSWAMTFPQGLGLRAGAEFVRELVEEGRYIRASSQFAFAPSTTANGDIYLMWGFGEGQDDQNSTYTEYEKFWNIMDYMNRNNFRVVLDVRADIRALRSAVEKQGTSVVIYSGKGNAHGFFDFFGSVVPGDIFAHKAKSLYQVVLAYNYSTQSLANYMIPKDLYVYSWDYSASSSELEQFLVSDKWDGFKGKNLGPRR